METYFKKEDSFLKVIGEGEYSITENKDIFKSIIAFCQTENLTKAIIDLREVTGQCLKFENYELFSDLHQVLSELNTPLHIAFCANGNILQDASFVNQIIGTSAPTFFTDQNYDGALNWIESIESPSKEKIIQ